MKYSYIKKHFSTFNVELKTVADLRKEIKKVWKLEKYYREKYFNSSSNYTYYYDFFVFYGHIRLELEALLEEYEEKERNNDKTND